MNKFAFAFASALVAFPAAAAVSVPSTPAPFAALNDSVTLNFGDGYANDVQQPGLEAAAAFRLSSRSGGNGTTNWTGWTFTIDNLANLSSGSVTAARLVSFGFDVAPNVADASATGMFDLKSIGSSISNGINVEVCFRDTGGNCAGGGGGGLSIGQAIPNGAFPNNTFTLLFQQAQSAIQLDRFVVRYQGINTVGGLNGGSGVGIVGDGPIDPNGTVPEPSSWAMLIAGFGLVGAVARRRKQQGLSVAA
jgi:PEP-CTERM motif